MPIDRPNNPPMTGTPAPPPVLAGDALVIAELAERAAARTPLTIDDDTIGFILEHGQKLELVDLTQNRDTPSRKTGNVQTVDADSFVVYVKRNLTGEGTTVWADIARASLVAVIDDHEVDEGDPGWGQHRASLTLAQTVDWEHWFKRDGALMSQDEFAEHIEDGVDAIREPDAATMLELAQTFHATSGASVDSTRRLSGEIQFSYTEETTASAGATRGSMEIPQQFTLGLAPFEGTDEYAVMARFRFRLHDKQLRLGYRLVRPDQVRRQAIDDVIDRVGEQLDLPVMLGVPAAAR